MARRLPCIAFGAVLLAVGAYILATSGELPDRVATHFGARGAPDGWMRRHGYTVYMLAFSVAFPLLLTAAIGWLPGAFPRFVNVPNAGYWLAPERRRTSIAYLGAHACRLGCAMSLTAAGMHWLLLRASRLDPPRLETGLFLAILGASLAAVVVWVVALQRRFRRPNA